MNIWDILKNMVLVLTGLNIIVVVLVFLVYGKLGVYRGLLWLYMRRPNHVGSNCLVFYLDPPGPWPGVCEICKYIDSCEFMAWTPRAELDEVDKELPE